MGYVNFPKPMGYETIKTHEGEEYTLNQVLEAKDSLEEIVNTCNEFISNVDIPIDENNILYHVIIYESFRYTDFIQPKNIIDFYYHIKNLYNSTSDENKKLLLTSKEFNKLSKVLYKNRDIYYTDTTIEPCSNCAICTEKFKQNSINVILDCKHNFHTNCLKKWVTEESATCPICKQEIIIKI